MKKDNFPTVFPNPFSTAYWRCAASQLGDVRMLCIAALMIALRVALKSVKIPVGQDLNIQIAFFANALGAMIFGPVVALLAAAVSDTLGCAITGFAGYYFPFIFVEMAGSLLFALWLWRAKLTGVRVILSRFSVVFVCNFIMNPIVMNWYYAWLNNGKSYKYVTLPRVLKNLALFPLESLLLVCFLGVMIAPLVKIGVLPKGTEKPTLEKKHIILLSVLFLMAAAFVVMYYFRGTLFGLK